MNKYWYLLFIVLIASCGIKSKYAISEKNKDIELYTTVYRANADSLFVNAFITFPISNLVFVKKDNQFEASIETNIRLENIENSNQIDRISNSSKVVKQYYEDTRSNQTHRIEYNFYLLKDNYKILTSIKDLDSFNTWNTHGIIDSSETQLGVFSYQNNQSGKEYLIDGLIGQDDQLWVEAPKYLFDSHNYKYSINKGDSISELFILQDCINEELFYVCPLSIPNDMYGDFKIDFISEIADIFSFNVYRNKNTLLWSSDINVILGVMNYILPYSEIKLLYKLSEADQLKFVIEYIQNKDLDSKTSKNEFLELIKKRFQYVNDNFYQYNEGWKTDRGRVYIVNGPPNSIEELYDNVSMTNKEVWYYTNKTFIFSNERTFGELKLIREL